MSTTVKICGIRSAADGLAAVEAGAGMLGFIFYRPVRRYVEPALAADVIAACRERHGDWQAVGVFVDEPAKSVNAIARRCRLDAVQLAGDEPPGYLAELAVPAIKVLRSGEAPWTGELLRGAQHGYVVQRFMVDTHVDGFYGGTGVAGDWQALAGLMDTHILAGGLSPDNVRAALELTRPWGVDVSSGVERDGVKDPALIRQFIEAVRLHDRSNS